MSNISVPSSREEQEKPVDPEWLKASKSNTEKMKLAFANYQQARKDKVAEDESTTGEKDLISPPSAEFQEDITYSSDPTVIDAWSPAKAVEQGLRERDRERERKRERDKFINIYPITDWILTGDERKLTVGPDNKQVTYYGMSFNLEGESESRSIWRRYNQFYLFRKRLQGKISALSKESGFPPTITEQFRILDKKFQGKIRRSMQWDNEPRKASLTLWVEALHKILSELPTNWYGQFGITVNHFFNGTGMEPTSSGGGYRRRKKAVTKRKKVSKSRKSKRRLKTKRR